MKRPIKQKQTNKTYIQQLEEYIDYMEGKFIGCKRCVHQSKESNEPPCDECDVDCSLFELRRECTIAQPMQ